ncbi:putative DNA-binding WGR domain protein [Oleiagrimonas soli]|nr:putative DNA-binding WGR domain protein [Oleiagrimonas soli]
MDGYIDRPERLPFMRIYMQTNAEAGETPRYVQLTLEQDLLGGWILLRESGRQGGRATLRREVFLEDKDAIAAFEKTRDSQIKRGYRVVFTQGAA